MSIRNISSVRYNIEIICYNGIPKVARFSTRKGGIKFQKAFTETGEYKEYYVEYDDFGVYAYENEKDRTWVEDFGNELFNQSYHPNKSMKWINKRKLRKPE